MIRVLLFIALVFIYPCLALVGPAKQEGKNLGKKLSAVAFKRDRIIDSNDLLPDDLKGKKFDSKEPLEILKKGKKTKSEVLNFLTSPGVLANQASRSFNEDEGFIKISEEIFNKENKTTLKDFQDNDVSHVLHTCKKGGDPILITTERILSVQVTGGCDDKVKKCLGHREEIMVMNQKYTTEEAKKKVKNAFKSKKSINPKSIKLKLLYANLNEGVYVFDVYYEHNDDTEECQNCKKKKKGKPLKFQERDEWIYQDLELWNLAKSIDSTIIEHTCIDPSLTKIIEGNSISRQCWKEKISFLHKFPSVDDCNFLKSKYCEQIKQECIRFHSSICTQWQLTFRCNENVKITTSSPFDCDSEEESVTYSPNQSFSDVAAKLAVFEHIKKEMEESQEIDSTKIGIFNGNMRTCSKNVSDELMYDCCFRYSGLAKEIGLTKCTADEIALAEMQEKGLCHYVGSYEEKFLELWKSRDEHVFCCFPSNLSRIVHEQGRKQLGIDWGTPKHPNCRGLTSDELSRIDFSKLDLSEVCESFQKKMKRNVADRLESFQKRLRSDIEQAEIKK